MLIKGSSQTVMDQLQQLFKYDLWANRKIAAILSDQSSRAPNKCNALFAHLAVAQDVWYKRITGGNTSTINLWPDDLSVKQALNLLEKRHDDWMQLLRSADTERDVTYANSSGTEFTTPLTGILHHVIIHGQHHRAQMAMLLRQNEISPPATDFIFYLREQ